MFRAGVGGHSRFKIHLCLPLIPHYSRTLQRCLLLQVFLFSSFSFFCICPGLYFSLMELCAFLSLFKYILDKVKT